MAAAAIAEFDRLRAQAKATRSAVMSEGTYDADGLDPSWDDLTGLPDVTGLEVADLEDAAAELGIELPPDDATRLAKLGSGDRFKALAAKVGSAPLAAYIGRKKLGRGKFAALAAAARKKKPGVTNAPMDATRSTGELFRYWPLEECRILRAAEGQEYGSGRVVEAYAAVFDTPAEIKDHEGHYVEDIDRAAFDDVLHEIAPERNRGYWNATCLYNHGMTVHGTPAERFSLPAGVPKHISAEGLGLLTRTEYAPTPLGDELLTLVEMGALRSQSFTGGIIRSSPPLRGPGDRYRRAAGGMLQRVRRLKLGLREYGLTPFAAYSGAEVLGVRMQLPGDYIGAGDDTEFEDALASEGDGAGGPPEAGTSSRSTGNRLYALRSEELLKRAGIDLP
jgi:phage head maturation protease